MISFSDEMDEAAKQSTIEVVETARTAAGFLMGLRSAIEDHKRMYGVFIGSDNAIISDAAVLTLLDSLATHIDSAKEIINDPTAD